MWWEWVFPVPPVVPVRTNVLFSVLLQHYYQNKLKLAIIGQSLFGQEVYSNLRKQGHKVVGVFTVPDKDGKADPLGKLSLYLLVLSNMWSTDCSHALLVLQWPNTVDGLLCTRNNFSMVYLTPRESDSLIQMVQLDV